MRGPAIALALLVVAAVLAGVGYLAGDLRIPVKEQRLDIDLDLRR